MDSQSALFQLLPYKNFIFLGKEHTDPSVTLNGHSLSLYLFLRREEINILGRYEQGMLGKNGFFFPIFLTVRFSFLPLCMELQDLSKSHNYTSSKTYTSSSTDCCDSSCSQKHHEFSWRTSDCLRYLVRDSGCNIAMDPLKISWADGSSSSQEWTKPKRVRRLCEKE